MVCPDGIRIRPNLRRASASRLLAALMTATRVLMVAVHGAGALTLMRRTRCRRAVRRCSGAQTDTVYQECQYCNDCDLNTEQHQNTHGRRPVAALTLQILSSSVKL